MFFVLFFNFIGPKLEIIETFRIMWLSIFGVAYCRKKASKKRKGGRKREKEREIQQLQNETYLLCFNV